MLPLLTNNNRWLLAAFIVECVAATMVAVDGSNSGCPLRQQQWD
jgi:hypothetical protein